MQAPATTDEKPEACETKETKAPEEEQEKSAAEAEEPKEAATDAKQESVVANELLASAAKSDVASKSDHNPESGSLVVSKKRTLD